MTPAKRLVVRRIWIDPNRCTATTLCGPEAPGLIEHDEPADVFVVRERELKRTLEELRLLFDAAGVCPMSAFLITLSNGETYNIDYEPWIQSAIDRGDYEWE